MQYKFYNRNPLGKREKDCVCRAISLAVELDYYEIEKKLNLVADLFDCEELCVCCYKYLLDNVFGLKRIEEYHGESISDFLKDHTQGVFIIRIEGHLTCAVDGVIHDIWDCTGETVDIIWEVEE